MPPAIPDSVCWMPLNRKRTLWSSQTDCEDTAPLIGTRLPNTKDLCFGFLIFIWNRTHALPWRQEWTPRNTAKRSASEMQRGTRDFRGKFTGQENVLSKACQWTLQNAIMDSPFCSWTVRSAEKRIFGENFSSPTDDFGGSKMRGYCLRQVFVGFPIFALGVCVSTVEWRFLLWAVNNHLNKKPSRTAIRLCARCTLEEGC